MQSMKWTVVAVLTGLLSTGVWAQNGVPDDTQALKTLTAYRYGANQTPLEVWRQKINAAPDAARLDRIAELLAGQLADQASPEAKRFICEQLALIGSGQQVAAIAPLLLDNDLSVAARGALEGIGGEPARAALRQALTHTSGPEQAGIIQSLGKMHDESAVPGLLPLLKSNDQAILTATLRALAEIATQPAGQALLVLDGKLSGPAQLALEESLIVYGYRLTEQARKEPAHATFEQLLKSQRSAAIRKPAFAGFLTTMPGDPGKPLMEALAGADPVLSAAAIDYLRQTQSQVTLAGINTQFNCLPPAAQQMLIQLWVELKQKDCLPALLTAMTSPEDAVRQSALGAFGTLGNADAAMELLKRVKEANDSERKIIQASLTQLNDGALNAKLANLLTELDSPTATVVLEVLTDRQASNAVPAILALCQKPDTALGEPAIDALGQLARPADLEAIITIADRIRPPLRPATLRTALARIGRIDPVAGSAVLVKAYPRLKNTGGVTLAALGDLGQPEGLALLLKELHAVPLIIQGDALRALAGWPDFSAFEGLCQFAGETTHPTLKTLALRGGASLLAQADSLTVEAGSGHFIRLAGLATETRDKKGLLTIADRMVWPAVLQWTVTLLGDGQLGNDAALATLALAGKMNDTPQNRGLALTALKQVVSQCRDSALQNRALGQMERLLAPVNLARLAVIDSPDGLEADGQAGGDQAAIDGNPDTYWDETDNQPLYRLRLQWAAPQEIHRIRITGYQQQNYAPRDFTLEVDGKPIQPVTGAVYTNNLLEIELPPTIAQTLELKITGYYGKSPAIRELELFGPNPALVEWLKELPPHLSWQQTDTSLALLNWGQTVWRFSYSTDTAKPYFHPVGLLDGTVLTGKSPADHVWHHGLWFSWKYLNGVNFWEENRQTGQSDGITHWTDVNIEPHDDFSALIRLSLDYHLPDQPPLLVEQRSITLSAPTAEGRYQIDWTSQFTARQKTELNRTPLPDEPGGQSWGGYTGLSWRFCSGIVGGVYTNSAGPIALTDGRFRGRDSFIAFNGNIHDQPFGVAMLDYPTNLNSPVPWYPIQDGTMEFINASPLCYGPHTMAPGDRFSLKYRILIGNEPWTPQQLKAEYEAFTR